MSQHDTRRNDKSYLFQVLQAEHENCFKKLKAWTKAQMEPEDVKLVLQEFEEWLKSEKND
jgi:hypothetical protein